MQAVSRTTSRPNAAERAAAYRLGQTAVRHWPAARKALPQSATVADWRSKCMADFLASMTADGAALVADYLAGFDAVVAEANEQAAEAVRLADDAAADAERARLAAIAAQNAAGAACALAAAVKSA